MKNFLMVLLFLSSSMNLVQADGELDTTGFNPPIGFVENIAGVGGAVAVDSNDRIIVYGQTAVFIAPTVTARYSSSGVEDAAYLANTSTSTILNGGMYSLVVLADGSAIIAGFDLAQNIKLRKYDVDGNPVVAFNTNVDATAVGGNPNTLSLQADLKLIVAGNTLSDRAQVVRFNADGTLDSTFVAATIASGGGIAAVEATQNILFGSSDDSSSAVVERLDTTGAVVGSIVLTGDALELSNINPVANGSFFVVGSTEVGGYLVHINADLTLDTAFNANAAAAFAASPFTGKEVFFDSVVQSDGKIILAGRNGINALITRFNADGTLDTTFNMTGINSFAPAPSFTGIALDATNRIVTGATNLLASDILVAVFTNTLPVMPLVVTSPVNGATLLTQTVTFVGTGPASTDITLALTNATTGVITTYGPIAVDSSGNWLFTVPVALPAALYDATFTDGADIATISFTIVTTPIPPISIYSLIAAAIAAKYC